MTAATITATEPKLDVGWVAKATGDVLRRRAGDLILVALPFVWLPSVVTGFAPDNRGLELLSNIPAMVFTGGASLLTYRELTGGERLTAGASIREGAARFGTLWVAAFVSGLATLLGLILLIVPGIIVALGFATAATVVMAERKTAMPALERAWSLSRGNRWRLAALGGLVILVTLALLAVGLVLGVILGLSGASSAIDAVSTFGYGPIIETIVAAVTAVGSAAAYVALRTAKEGASEDIARTFD